MYRVLTILGFITWTILFVCTIGSEFETLPLMAFFWFMAFVHYQCYLYESRPIPQEVIDFMDLNTAQRVYLLSEYPDVEWFHTEIYFEHGVMKKFRKKQDKICML